MSAVYVHASADSLRDDYTASIDTNYYYKFSDTWYKYPVRASRRSCYTAQEGSRARGHTPRSGHTRQRTCTLSHEPHPPRRRVPAPPGQLTRLVALRWHGDPRCLKRKRHPRDASSYTHWRLGAVHSHYTVFTAGRALPTIGSPWTI